MVSALLRGYLPVNLIDESFMSGDEGSLVPCPADLKEIVLRACRPFDDYQAVTFLHWWLTP